MHDFQKLITEVEAGNLTSAHQLLSESTPSEIAMEMNAQCGPDGVARYAVAVAPALINDGRYDDAESILAMVFDYRPSECLDLLTKSMLQRQAYDGLIDMLKTKAKNLEGSTHFHNVVTRVIESMGKDASSEASRLIAEMRKVIQNQQMRLWLDYGEACLLSENGNRPEANRLLTEILPRTEDGLRAAVYQSLGENLLALKQYSEVVELYSDALDKFSDTAEVPEVVAGCLLGLSSAYTGLGKFRKSDRALRKVMKMKNAPEWAAGYAERSLANR